MKLIDLGRGVGGLEKACTHPGACRTWGVKFSQQRLDRDLSVDVNVHVGHLRFRGGGAKVDGVPESTAGVWARIRETFSGRIQTGEVDSSLAVMWMQHHIRRICPRGRGWGAWHNPSWERKAALAVSFLGG